MRNQSLRASVSADRRSVTALLTTLTANDERIIDMATPQLRPAGTLGNFIDLTGARFGHLQVLERAENSEKGATRWLCRCDCGKDKIIFAANLGRANTSSCGCARKKLTSERTKTHGLRKSPEYRCWAGMITRCTNRNDRSFKRYGGRGITICDRWLNSFENFYADMGQKPTRDHSIDRWPDTNGNYEPGNCRWATDREQRRNKRNNLFVEIAGERLCFSDAARKYGVKRLTARTRLFKLGWTVEQAFGLIKRG